MGSLEGRTLGHFRVERMIGSGGMGAVYEAVDEKLERNVALKVLLQDGDSELHKKRFLREARLAAKLTHPNIATVFEVGEFESHLYIVMEMLEGHSLRKVLGTRRLATDEALGIARDMARALARAHAGGVTHRDIKPENIFITTPAPDVLHAKVLDFGLARQQKEKAPVPENRRNQEHTATDVTKPGDIIGTPGYWSPEQARSDTVDARTDIFSFGLVLYEMLSGRRAFKGNATVALVLAVTRQEPEPIRKLVPNVAADVEALIARCIAKDPAQRFADGSELLEAVEAVARSSARLSAMDLETADDTMADAHGPPVDVDALTTRTPASEPAIPTAPVSAPARESLPSPSAGASAPTPGPSTFDEMPSALIRPRERIRLIVAVSAGVLFAAVLLIVAASVWSGSNSANASAATPPPSASAAPPIVEPAPPPEPPVFAASAPITSSTTATTTPPAAPPASSNASPAASARPRRDRKPDCAQPFTIDSKGVKIPKLQCL